MTAIRIITPLLAFLLMACQSTDRQAPVESMSVLNESIQNDKNITPPPPAMMPESVQNELALQSLQSEFSTTIRAERRFDVSANNVEASVFFPSLVQGTPLSVVVHPNVTGTISLSLKEVTLSEVLQVIEDIYGYEVSQENRILRIFPAGMRTETFALNYLQMKRQGLSLTTVTSGSITDQDNNSNSGNSNNSNNNNSDSSSNNGSNSNSNSETTSGTFIRSATNTDFWGELKETLVSIIGGTADGRQVVLTPQASLVTIRAYPNELRQAKSFLKTAESHLQRQVILEAKILEVTLSDGYQQGIEWQQVLGHVGDTDVTFGTSPSAGVSNQITSAIGGVTSLSISGADFTTMISLLDTQGDVDVLSSPRVTATNNQKAVIKVGKDEYFVTNVSSTTVGGTNPVTTPQVDLTPFFSGIALDVTPQIDGEGNILLHIHPSVINIKEQSKTITIAGSDLVLPLAQSDIRESDTVIRARTGEVVVIGGLMKSENLDQVSKVPFLGDIPLLGELFTNRAKSLQKTELVILLKPTVVEANTWKKELERSKDLLDRWYPEEENESGQ
ncbi:pilus (MSHA type) biogenesis protein MshL [Shewanella sp. D64]|uniref:pilus (MSHA type) biogenesis protein MshL n=1 Tax=unclassified Shewanella TaxID=196818 RepID=UPI0022BA2806|nr:MULTISPECIES: pilus (MSHA type) biogenesis protein MshL [unclassified Shewanella]MEC4725440.1 pilus (MSHA type) biogenesis protein MshL [Shewanella sp. D64]MEC4738743.1 pilus (MSHA type) biogenesis protein MshL [Shewanella sp. E94]WBJ95035.1 pilus (MSHA type) biogenesis protein MshL [Shewanella sp. MTB7]